MSQEKHELEAQSEETHDVGLHDGDQQMKLESSTTITGVKYSGPLPHPSIMMEYKKLDPKIPDVIIQEFQKANDFYREQDRMDLQAQIKEVERQQEMAARRQNMAFALTILLLIVAVVAMVLGQDIFANITGLAFIGILIRAFLTKK